MKTLGRHRHRRRSQRARQRLLSATCRPPILLVVENEWVGGAATSRSLTPGFLYSNCSYVCSLFRPEIMRDLELPRFGLQVISYEGGAV